MEIKNSQFIPLLPDATWEALNNPDVLAACIPGCESVTKESDTDMRIVMQAKVGPVSAKFRGKMTLSDVNPPTSYTVSFEGQGGAMGFGKGQAKVSLAAAEGGTEMTYVVIAQVGGKLAQIGARLIDAAALKLADDFFTRFIKQVAADSVANASPASASLAAIQVNGSKIKPSPPAASRYSKNWRWLLLVLAFVIAYLVLSR